MNTIGYVLVLVALLIVNAVARGRVMHLPSDLGEAFTAAITGDYADLKDVLTRSGDDLQPTPVQLAGDSTGEGTSGTGLLSEMKRLAVIADNKYVFGTTGPDSYDCSGLVWRACRNLGIYTGSRFTTVTFPLAARSFTTPADSPKVGDIVVWPRKHMGVVSGEDRFYSARNHKSGIGESRLSTWPGGQPRYYRLNFSLNPNAGGPGQGLGVSK